MLTFEPCVLHIFGIDAHGRVAHDGFRACGCHDCIKSFVVLVHDVAFFHLPAVGFHDTILQIIKFRMLFFINHFFIRECRLCLRVPVYHTYTAIDESFLIEIAEHFDDTFAPYLVHGERSAVPIT